MDAWIVFLMGSAIEIIAPVSIAIVGRLGITLFFILVYLGFRE